MPELLLEVGCEELPASFIEQAANDLRDAVAERLVETGLGQAEDAEALGKEATVLSTPRRLIVSFPDVASRQPDRVDEKRGPSLKASYDASGASTQALIGFCRSVGLEPAQLRQEGDYVWASKPVAGRSAPEVLAELLPEAIRSLSFAKSMRWGSGRMRFARPIRWILAAFDGEAVEFEIEGVRSGLTSRGHRFLSPDPFEARSLAPLLVGLRQREVEPDAEQRKKKIEAELRALGFDDQLEESDEEPPGSEHEPLEEYLQRQHRRSVVKELIRENVGLAEWPRAVAGHFRPEYLPLPAVVLEATMAKHEKMFPIWDESGKVTNRFVFVANSGDDDTVRAGAEWVLNARFGDAKFFYDEDLKHDMNYFLARTKTIVFHEKLGSVRQRAGRLELLVQAVALDTAGDHAAPNLGLAGKYSKADLASGLVSELPDLQGRIGAEYVMQAHSFGDSTKAISDVIKYQYDPRAIRVYGCDDLPLGVADQLDILAGYLALGEAPSGSSDPHGLRRAAVLLIQSASSPLSKLVDGFENLIRSAIDGY
ncbi:MAG: glycine--tRNA ligase subunit beta, partial [Fimbriimonas ginsengisoli]|nr:glycine--tRNA ligase subunit beta [Fimbriimonas ginsengisoli]